ncbi:hypothetical protein LXA43DRAFT_969528 [Ganoderma leucocontextum]|nr:hypothetical protein LXA43DRAFT_969528 [Ganoderma leucocontextum]
MTVTARESCNDPSTIKPVRCDDTIHTQFVEKDPADTEYAILSHPWDSKGEQTYKQLRNRNDTIQPLSGTGTSPPRSEAHANGYQYIWIDSCCIDKSSSSKFSVAINSMYAWYARTKVYHAYLADVPAGGDHRRAWSPFRKSRWFTRGWTLQELIAPLDVVFLSWDWAVIGPKAFLHVESLDRFSVAQRLSWAARRETTKEEIMRRIPDYSLFAWGEVYLGSQTSAPT